MNEPDLPTFAVEDKPKWYVTMAHVVIAAAILAALIIWAIRSPRIPPVQTSPPPSAQPAGVDVDTITRLCDKAFQAGINCAVAVHYRWIVDELKAGRTPDPRGIPWPEWEARAYYLLTNSGAYTGAATPWNRDAITNDGWRQVPVVTKKP